VTLPETKSKETVIMLFVNVSIINGHECAPNPWRIRSERMIREEMEFGENIYTHGKDVIISDLIYVGF
jgi:hypothetical protein